MIRFLSWHLFGVLPRRDVNSHHWYTATQSLSFMSIAVDHSATFAMKKSFNSRSNYLYIYIYTTNRSRTSDRMFSGDAYTSSKKQQFYFWLKPLSSNEWDSYGNQSGTSYASVNQVVTSVASAVSNWNTHKCSIARREERSIRSFAMSIAKHLMWFTSLTVTSADCNT